MNKQRIPVVICFLRIDSPLKNLLHSFPNLEIVLTVHVVFFNWKGNNRMPQYKCNSCDKNVMYKSRGFIYFLFWPWTMLFMKKKCPVCGIEVQKIP
jgi:endogenous inhibitor of DNA gyrase (YacG/DUF329 family)